MGQKKRKCRVCGNIINPHLRMRWPGCCSRECKQVRTRTMENRFRNKKKWSNYRAPVTLFDSSRLKGECKQHKLRKKAIQSDEFYESIEWINLRFKALTMHGRKCLCCGARPPDVVLHVDHIKPRSIYPELALEISNLQVLCAKCNLGKGFKYQNDFRDSATKEAIVSPVTIIKSRC